MSHTPADGTGLLVDTDVHPYLQFGDEVAARLPEPFRSMSQGPGPSLGGERLYLNPHGAERDDARPEGDTVEASLERFREQHLDRYGVDYCIVNNVQPSHGPNADYQTARASAWNDWMAETWLQADDRILSSMSVCMADPERAAEEIRRVGDHPRFVQVGLPSATREPYGKRRYWPVYEAAAEMGLPVGIHPGGEGKGISNPPPGGYPSTYFEWHTTISANYMHQVASLVTEGVFAEFPDLRWVCIEGGLGWVPHLMWRLDKNWKTLRAEPPWLDRRPSDYIRQCIRFTTQPVEEPDDPAHLLDIFEMMDAQETVMFSSDYPHWDNDSPAFGLPALPDDVHDAIYFQNALDLYDLPEDPADLPHAA
jgi:predicted TIM-barrel fold metal-dependent hydrolase